MSYKLLVLTFITTSFILFSCGEKKTEPPKEDLSDKNDLENFADKMKEVSESFTGGKKVTPIDFRELKSLLPESIGDLKRSNLEGEKVAAMGMNISTANADYNDAENNISIDLKDH